MPISEKQLAANRANAQKSSGPRTEAGKAASSANALTHGLTAVRHMVLPSEDREQFDRLTAAFHARFPQAATDPAVFMIVHTLIRAAWLLRRIPDLEREVINEKWIDYAEDEGLSRRPRLPRSRPHLLYRASALERQARSARGQVSPLRPPLPPLAQELVGTQPPSPSASSRR